MKNADMPAMPISEYTMKGNAILGLSKREMFAMHAMHAQISVDDQVKPENVAIYAIEYADALLKELEK